MAHKSIQSPKSKWQEEKLFDPHISSSTFSFVLENNEKWRSFVLGFQKWEKKKDKNLYLNKG